MHACDDLGSKVVGYMCVASLFVKKLTKNVLVRLAQLILP